MICNFYYLTVTIARLSWIINVSKWPPFSLGKNAPNYTFDALGIFHWIGFDFFYSLVKPDTCPHGGARKESCECFHNRRASGITHFSKIRLNVTSLRVLSKFNAGFYIISFKISAGYFNGDCVVYVNWKWLTNFKANSINIHLNR